jgi:hypothetical protein
MTTEARDAMTLTEAMAENRKLEEELRQMAMEIARLKAELAAAPTNSSGVAGLRLRERLAERFAGVRGVRCEDLPGGC